MHCANCGSQVGLSASFCASCGARIQTEVSPFHHTEEERDHIVKVLDYVQRNSDAPQLLSVGPLVRLLVDAKAPMTPNEMKSILDLTEDQYCRWMARWLFSPAHSPDTLAENEQQGWKQIYDATARQLMDALPDLAELLSRSLSAGQLTAVFQLRAQLDEAGVTRPTSGLKSALVHGLNKLGSTKLAENAANRALFPKGTVGAALYWEK